MNDLSCFSTWANHLDGNYGISHLNVDLIAGEGAARLNIMLFLTKHLQGMFKPDRQKKNTGTVCICNDPVARIHVIYTVHAPFCKSTDN